ncbi:MAG: SSU ribosomal protein S17p (S11e), partial [uncultured Solirubrobacteraceae bacterium]
GRPRRHTRGRDGRSDGARGPPDPQGAQGRLPRGARAAPPLHARGPHRAAQGQGRRALAPAPAGAREGEGQPLRRSRPRPGAAAARRGLRQGPRRQGRLGQGGQDDHRAHRHRPPAPQVREDRPVVVQPARARRVQRRQRGRSRQGGRGAPPEPHQALAPGRSHGACEV